MGTYSQIVRVFVIQNYASRILCGYYDLAEDLAKLEYNVECMQRDR